MQVQPLSETQSRFGDNSQTHHQKDFSGSQRLIQKELSPSRRAFIPGYAGHLPNYHSNSLQVGKNKCYINNEAGNQSVVFLHKQNAAKDIRNFAYTGQNVIQPILGYKGCIRVNVDIDKSPINKTYGQQGTRILKPLPGYAGHRRYNEINQVQKVGGFYEKKYL